jgi:hypothetical protein
VQTLLLLTLQLWNARHCLKKKKTHEKHIFIKLKQKIIQEHREIPVIAFTEK